MATCGPAQLPGSSRAAGPPSLPAAGDGFYPAGAPRGLDARVS